MTKEPFHPVAIAFGANLGEPRRAIAQALGQLQASGLEGLRASDLFETQPVGCVPGTPPFVNGVVVGQWPRTAHDLLHLCQRLETEAGRAALHSQQEARVLDLDILLFGQLRMTLPELTVPHPRLVERLFVLVPLAQLVPDWRVPGTALTVAAWRDRELHRHGDSWGHRLADPPVPSR